MSNENETRSENQSMKRWVWQSIILAGIPTLGYTLAYVHELGFCNEFEIPNEFIILDWTSILFAIGKILGIVLILLLYVQVFVVLKFWSEKLGPINQRLIRYFVIFLPLLIISIPYPSFWLEVLLVFLFFISLLLFVDFLQPLIKSTDVKGYRNKLKHQDEFFERKIPWLDRFIRKIGMRNILILFFIIPLLFVASNFDGGDTAKRQEEFLIPSTNQQLVVLRIYGDNLICAPLDREAKEIERSFYILEMSDTVLTPEKVGPLSVSSNIQE